MNGLFLANILLAIAWVAVSGSFSVPNMLFGFLLGMIALFIIREQLGTLSHLQRGRRLASLLFLFISELLKSATPRCHAGLQPQTGSQTRLLCL